MNLILNAISATAALMLGVGVIYILLDRTVGRLRLLHSKFVWYGLQIKDFAFIAVGLIAILSLATFVLPY